VSLTKLITNTPIFIHRHQRCSYEIDLDYEEEEDEGDDVPAQATSASHHKARPSSRVSLDMLASLQYTII